MVKFTRDATGPGRVIDRRGVKPKKSKPQKGHPSMSSTPRKNYMEAQSKKQKNPFPKGHAMNPIVRTGSGSNRKKRR